MGWVARDGGEAAGGASKARRAGFQAPEDRQRWKAWLEGAITFKPRFRPPQERCYLYQPPAILQYSFVIL